jgi:predicted kinase
MDKKPLVTVLSGLPASGKTEYAREMDALRINLDDIRLMMGWTSPKFWSREKEAVAIQAMLSTIEAAVEDGYDVVVDNTHLTPKIPNLIRRRVGGRATFDVVHFLASVEDCIKRDANRDRPVGEADIRRMAKTKAKGWSLTAEYMNAWPEVEKVSQVPSGLPEAIIIDLDGTIAIHNGRSPYESERCDEDLLDDAVEAILFGYALTMAGAEWPYKVIFMSGREATELVKAKTEKWLRDNLALKIDYPEHGIEYELLMRAEGDERPDFVVKYDLFNEYVRDKYRVLFTIDDRDQIVRLWRELGIKTLQCAYGNY